MKITNKNKVLKLITKAKSYKYKKCRDKFTKKHFGINSNDYITPISIIELVVKINSF